MKERNCHSVVQPTSQSVVSSTAKCHQREFDRHVEQFKSSAGGTHGQVKSLIFVAVEQTMYQTTMLAWIRCFIRHDFDGIFVFSNAPGFSATKSKDALHHSAEIQ